MADPNGTLVKYRRGVQRGISGQKVTFAGSWALACRQGQKGVSREWAPPDPSAPYPNSFENKEPEPWEPCVHRGAALSRPVHDAGVEREEEQEGPAFCAPSIATLPQCAHLTQGQPAHCGVHLRKEQHSHRTA